MPITSPFELANRDFGQASSDKQALSNGTKGLSEEIVESSSLDSCNNSLEQIDKVIIHKKRKRRSSENSNGCNERRPQTDPTPIMTDSLAKISVITAKRAASTESAEVQAQKRRKKSKHIILVKKSQVVLLCEFFS